MGMIMSFLFYGRLWDKVQSPAVPITRR
jgi:hypothetical protein